MVFRLVLLVDWKPTIATATVPPTPTRVAAALMSADWTMGSMRGCYRWGQVCGPTIPSAPSPRDE